MTLDATALAKLVAPTHGATSKARALPPLTGNKVPAGGDAERVLIAPAALTYYNEDLKARIYPEVTVGDVVLLGEQAARRLDGLKCTLTLEQYNQTSDATDALVDHQDDDTPPVAEPVKVEDATPPVNAEAPTSTTGDTPAEGTVPAFHDPAVLAALPSAELVEYVREHPDSADVVEELEGKRREKDRRKSVAAAIAEAREAKA